MTISRLCFLFRLYPKIVIINSYNNIFLDFFLFIIILFLDCSERPESGWSRIRVILYYRMMKAAHIQSNLEKPEYDDILVFPEPGYDDIPALFF